MMVMKNFEIILSSLFSDLLECAMYQKSEYAVSLLAEILFELQWYYIYPSFTDRKAKQLEKIDNILSDYKNWLYVHKSEIEEGGEIDVESLISEITYLQCLLFKEYEKEDKRC